jgi:hypothetical protein
MPTKTKPREPQPRQPESPNQGDRGAPTEATTTVPEPSSGEMHPSYGTEKENKGQGAGGAQDTELR